MSAEKYVRGVDISSIWGDAILIIPKHVNRSVTK